MSHTDCTISIFQVHTLEGSVTMKSHFFGNCNETLRVRLFAPILLLLLLAACECFWLRVSATGCV